MIEQFSASKDRIDQIARSSADFDSKWIKKQVKSKISEYDFEENVYDLVTKNFITLDQCKDIVREFRNLREKAKEKAKISESYDTKWVKKQAKSDISFGDFKK